MPIKKSKLLLFRVNFYVNCVMDFQLYPVDEQICIVKFESWGMQSSQVGYEAIFTLGF